MPSSELSNANDIGRAYEYICLIVLFEEIENQRKCEIKKNSTFYVDESCWNALDDEMKSRLRISAASIKDTLFELEPLILEDQDETLFLYLQTDKEGEKGDVRDIVLARDKIKWEIGLSIKHNHFAVKHSRLSNNIDFGEKWFSVPCSQNYWNVVKNIFNYLSTLQSENVKWSDIEDKEEGVYRPVLQAFRDEIIASSKKHCDIPRKMVEYLLGEYDFYKVISVDADELTQLQAFNLHGSLNKKGKKELVKIVPQTSLPSRIVSFDFKPNSNTTLELYMDNGWQFSFRIHNASSYVEPSLKFDIQIVGMPTTILTIYCRWRS